MTSDPEATHWDGPGLDAWHPWTPPEMAHHLSTVSVPWCVVGGWSIDLFLGEQSRDHEDLEIAVLRGHFGEVRRALAGFVFHVVGDGEVRRLDDDVEPPREKHQNWVLDPVANVWRADVMLEPGDETTWVYRRDESIRAPRDFMVRQTGDGIPFVAPHGALLFKAKAARPKDEADLAMCLPRMTPDECAWLAGALRSEDPAHRWLPGIEARAG
jgi:hypothetical protein